jgi:hypothetical protein
MPSISVIDEAIASIIMVFWRMMAIRRPMMLSDEVLAHYVRHWGEPSGEQGFRRSDFAVTVYDWDSCSDGEDVHLYATVGASAWPLPHFPRSHRFEVFIGLLPPQHEVRHLLADVAYYPLKNPGGHWR